jgi:hypothetical protein
MLIEDLYDDVAQRVPATPQLIENAVTIALGRFLRGSTAWRLRATFTAEAGKAEFDLSALTDDGLIFTAIEMRVVGAADPIGATTVRDLDRRVPAWRNATAREPVAFVAPHEPHLVRFYPVPDEDVEIEVELALYCSQASTEIPDWIGEMYRQELVEGACGVLYRIHNKPWTDLKLSKDCEGVIDDATRAARNRMDKSHTRAIVTANFTSFDEL